MGLRTETTINNPYDFGVGRRLCNLPALRQIGFEANRRILEVEKLTHDCNIGQQSFQQLQQPADVEGQHVSALRFDLADEHCRSDRADWDAARFGAADAVEYVHLVRGRHDFGVSCRPAQSSSLP